MQRPTSVRKRRLAGPSLAVALVAAAIASPPRAADPPAARLPFDAGRAGFAIKVGAEIVPYRVMAVPALPGEVVRISLARGVDPAGFRATAAGGRIKVHRSGAWDWTAPPTPGPREVVVERVGTDDRIVLNVLVQVPMERVRDGSLNGYRIGAYPAKPLKNLPIYRRPAGMIEVTEDLVDLPVSPHFRLGQFLCKQDGGFPKYVVLQTRLLTKLEFLLQVVNEAGIRTDGFAVMSGYRTPFYNQAIGNVPYSRHVWGGAADIYVDESPRDGEMDDLDGNGVVDAADAAFLYDLVDGLYGDPEFEPFVGGLGRYDRNAAHGPFVHVDVRGFRARWGN